MEWKKEKRHRWQRTCIGAVESWERSGKCGVWNPAKEEEEKRKRTEKWGH